LRELKKQMSKPRGQRNKAAHARWHGETSSDVVARFVSYSANTKQHGIVEGSAELQEYQQELDRLIVAAQKLSADILRAVSK
jgi:hypothetical protein